MQTTLLGVAIAVILALVAALVGPLLIDWSGHRSLFEAEASRLVGVDVHVKGGIDARLLPSPQITLHDIEIGDSGGEKVHARALDVEFALGPLMRGEWQATKLHLDGPRIQLRLDPNGQLQAPKLSIGFKPETLSIESLSITEGKIILVEAAGEHSVTLDHLYFNGEANSLVGPYKGEGGVSVAGDHFPFRLTTGRYGGTGTLKVHLNVDPRDHPIAADLNGVLSLSDGKPSFEGSFNLRRLVGIGGGKVEQPWSLQGKLKANASSALLQDASFQYGAEDKGLTLTGIADLRLGKDPRLKAELSGRQLDLDQFIGGEKGSSAPGAAARKLAVIVASTFHPPLPIEVGIGIDQVTLAGNALQNVRGDISADASGWSLNDFEFRAPGFTQAKLSGELTVDGHSVTFKGPAEIDSTDPKALAAWLEGRPAPAHDDLRPLSMRGDLTLGSEKVAIEHLTAKFARKTITGHFAYSFASGKEPSRLDAVLNAPAFDLDLALGFGKALYVGSGLARPREIDVTADIGRATLAGIEGHGVSVRVKADADHWEIDRLSVADLGGASFSAKGGLLFTGPSPQGNLRIDFGASDPKPVMTLLSRFAPTVAETLAPSAAAMAPAKLNADVAVDGAGPSEARFEIGGSLGKVKIALNGETQLDLKEFRVGKVRFDGKLSANEGKALADMLDIDRMVAIGKGPAALEVHGNGPAQGKWQITGKLTAKDLDAHVAGTALPFADNASADLRVAVERADVAPLGGRTGGADNLPARFTGRIRVDGNELSLSGIDATVADTNLRGKLSVSLDRPHRLRGEFEADRANGAAIIAAALGMPAAKAGRDAAWAWSSEPFGKGFFGDYAGEVALTVHRAQLLPQITARELHATVHFGQGQFSFDGINGVLAGGALTGHIRFKSGDEGLSTQGKFELSGADSAGLLQASTRPPVAGTLGLSVGFEGAGLSPIALIGSLHGDGAIKLVHAEFSGLDPNAFDAVTRAVDTGLPVEGSGISDVVRKSLEGGQLAAAEAGGKIAIAAGQAHLTGFSAAGSDANLSASANLDLTDGVLDARLVLAGPNAGRDGRPDIFLALKGPLGSPTRNIDVSALTGWLTMRSVENEARKLKAAQQEAQSAKQASRPPNKDNAAPPNPGSDHGPAEAKEAAKEPAPRSLNTSAPMAPAAKPATRAAERAPAIIKEKPPRPHRRAPPPARVQRAPALPAPIVIHPLPTPEGIAAPEASVRRLQP